jgi:hypothetical protein
VKSEDTTEKEIEGINQSIRKNGECVTGDIEPQEKDYEKIKNKSGKNLLVEMGSVYGNEVKKKAYNQICTPIYKNRECIIKSDFTSKGGKNATCLVVEMGNVYIQ